MALWLFVAVEIAAFGLWLALGRTEWFNNDDWQFLAGRGINPDALFTDHNTHWSTVPILVFRALWWMVGIRSYVPYLVIIIALHVTAAALLRIIMRRAGVNTWIATAGAASFAFFGAGYQNIVWAFQIGFVGGLVLGLVHMLLADHDGPIDRRDWLGLGAGLGSLLCAGVGVTMVGATSLAVFIRRGWRAAAFHAVPLGAIYFVWWFSIARHTEHPGVRTEDVGIADVGSFVRIGLQHAFEALAQSSALGILLGVLVVAGLVSAWERRDLMSFRRQAAVPGALAVGAVAFLAFSGYGRVGLLGPDFAKSSRYLHVVAALLLPLIAVALDGLARRARLVTPVVCALLLVGVPGSIDTLANYTNRREQMNRAYRHFILSIPRTKYASEVPAQVRPDTHHPDHAEITVGWLLGGAESGRFADPGPITPADDARIRFHLSFMQREGNRPQDIRCEELSQPVTRHFEEGDVIYIEGDAVRVSPVSKDVVPAAQMAFDPSDGSQLEAVLGPMDVVLQKRNIFSVVTVCE